MSKSTNSLASLNPEVVKSLELLGLRIRANRIAHGWTVKEMASRLFCSQNTYRAIEAGKPTTSIGVIANTLWLFGLMDSIDAVSPVQPGANSSVRVRRSRQANIPGVISEDERDF